MDTPYQFTFSFSHQINKTQRVGKTRIDKVERNGDKLKYIDFLSDIQRYIK